MLGAARGRAGGRRARLSRAAPRPGRARARGGRAVIWVGWRQQRWETIVAAAILAAIAALLIPTGLSMLSSYNNDGLNNCAGALQGGACDAAARQFIHEFDGIGNLIAWFTLVPGIIGILLAAPFVTDLERGTYRLE